MLCSYYVSEHGCMFSMQVEWCDARPFGIGNRNHLLAKNL